MSRVLIQSKSLHGIWNQIRGRCISAIRSSYNPETNRISPKKDHTIPPVWKDFSAFETWAASTGYQTGMGLQLKRGRTEYCLQNFEWCAGSRPRDEAAKHWPPHRSATGGCCVYLVQQEVTGAIKIGISSNVPSRLKGLQTSSPYKLTLIHAYRPTGSMSAIEAERRLHKEFCDVRLQGEWFSSQLDVDKVNMLMSKKFETIRRY